MPWIVLLFVTLTHSLPRPSLPCKDQVEKFDSSGYEIASKILTKSINFSFISTSFLTVQIDPCVDFFEFTCGNWIATHPIPDHKTSYSQFAVLSDKVQEEMRDIFESPEILQSKSTSGLKFMYHKCMDKDELNRIGAKNLIATIRSYGVWPIIDGHKWHAEQFDLTTILINIAQIRGVTVFISNYVSLDTKNVSRRLIEFDQGQLGLGDSTRDYYLDRGKHGKKIAAYRQYLINKVKLFHEDVNIPVKEEKIASDVDEIIELETKMAKILVPEEDRRNFTKLYNLRRLSDMQKLMPLVDWFRYFHSIAPVDVHEYLAADPEILINEIDYMRRIDNLLQSTDPRIITNYVYLRYSSSWGAELGERYEDIAQEFHRQMYGQKTKAPRWKDCTTRTMQRMQYASGSLYVSKYFDKTSKNVTLEMIDSLHDAFYAMVTENDWMDKATKAIALDKAKHMLKQIGYPDFILDDKKLDEYYDGLLIKDSDSYSQMMEKLSRWVIEFGFKRLIKPVDRTEYNFNPAVVNAFYSSTSNSIKFPAAILQAPFFHQTFPKALNYGGIGAVIGHEITHGFDDQGRQFDAVGNLREWWNDETKIKFEKRAQCIINQYGKIEVPEAGLKLKGKLTQGENIADNGGVKQAFRAYKNYLKKFGEEKRIKGLEQFDNEQMFFLGYATVWCGHSTVDSLINLILTDSHAPQKYRVNQVLANQPEFANAFKCDVGTPMNPTERCAVW
ncbi:peptidase family M13 [Dictyocaulus viviparus]|uniref:Peptidase family M13 n=1 Tax=Dictyocaulus viviparus TaxID=29172 RepID=A0A0D8XBH2_DICVI|nr:peptidase family M13 [Dictyocaulus viviparus]